LYQHKHQYLKEQGANLAPYPKEDITMWTPIIITDSRTGRKVHCTIFDAQLYQSGFWNFDDLWDIYGADVNVQIMNNMYDGS